VIAAHQILGFGPWIGGLHLTVGLIVLTAALIAATLTVSGAAQAVLSEEVYPRWMVDAGVGASINRLVHYAVVLLGILTVIGALGFELQNIVIIGGAIGVGIGFGLQSMVNNFVSGLILLVERPVKAGDVVVIGDVWGKITQVGLRATVVETFDQSEIVVPNSDLISKPVTNWTRSSRGARLTVPIGVAYGSDVPLVMRRLREAAEAHKLILRDPPAQVFFLGFGESSLKFELKAWIANVNDRLGVCSELNQAIDASFRQDGIEIPFPQRDLNLRNAVQVRLETTHPQQEQAASGDGLSDD
jgi:potassium-dependent mechanosensitive channel